jgi:processive 1,2-diacylglycerol beta-glucosyltransferase
MLQVVMQFPESVQALVVAGRNERLRERLAARARGQERRIQIHGFTDRVDLFLAASDVLVSKSGGLTCSEAMARGVPMIVVRPIPGQEERNCDFLQESGAALRARDLDELHYRLRHLLENPDDLAQMRARATAVGRPRSAHAVASAVLRLAGSFIP